MYKGYNLTLSKDKFDNRYFDELLERGRTHYENIKGNIANSINSFKNSDGTIDASKMQNGWFPQTHASIFLSHSHKDEDLAIALAAWIQENFHLEVFIDSCLWGNSTVLQRLLDDTYCQNPGGNTYDYDLRNLTTSHVHMMLQTALASMISTTECVIFLNTPNSISPDEVVDQTLSPWIYSELTTTSIVKSKSIDDYRRLLVEQRQFSAGGAIRPVFKYIPPIEHLTRMDSDTLVGWKERFNQAKTSGKPIHGLDALYDVI